MLTSRLFPRRPRRAAREATVAASVCARRSAGIIAAPSTASPVEALEPRQLFAVVSGFTETLVADGMARPTKLTFAPDGRLFISLQSGGIRVVKDGTLLSQPFATVPTLNDGERGLMSLAFDPDFANNHYVYTYYTASEPQPHNVVTRLTADGDVAVPGSETVIFEFDNTGSGIIHNGGGMEFGPDGKLYVSHGDNTFATDAPKLTSTRGKIHRINPDGTIPSDNPFYNEATGNARATWALGFRNPFSLDFLGNTDRLMVGDVGAADWEEVNDVTRGANYGWPSEEGPSDAPGVVTPFYAYPHDFAKSAVVGVNFYDPATPTFPAEYHGDLFFGDYNGGFIKSIDLGTNAIKDFASDIIKLSDVVTAADGSLYYLERGNNNENNARVFRVEPDNTPGLPNVSVPPQSQTVAVGAPVTFSVDAAGEGTLTYQWQRNGSNIAGATGASYTIDATTSADNGAKFRAVVSNSAGSVTSGEATLTVLNDQPPTATITLPADGTLWTGGGQISFSGTGTDAEDGNLPASAFTWEVVFHHDTHTHPFVAPFSDKTAGTVTVPAAFETAPNVWLRIHLTVTDSAGLSHSVFRDVFPQKVNVSLRTEPAGLGLTLDDQPVATPLDTEAVVGLERRIGAPATQTLDGVTYEFVSWSDGGEAVHAITTPGVDTVYTARYRKQQVGGPPGGGALGVDAVDGMQPGVAGRTGKVKVRVANRTAAAFNAPADVELFLSPDATFDATDMAVTSTGNRKLKLKPGATRPLAVRFTYPAVPVDGDYYLLARVAGSDVTASAAPMPVRNPAVDLSGSLGDTSRGAPVTPGGKAVTSVTVVNTGTDAISGPLAVTLFAVPEGDDPLTGVRTQVATVTKPVRINPGQAKKLKLTYTVPPTLAPGRYTLVFVVDSGNAFSEPNETNNTSVASVPLVVA